MPKAKLPARRKEKEPLVSRLQYHFAFHHFAKQKENEGGIDA
jgi:hypothetical protein